ncbi:MAG: hypothetical protein Kow00105_15320 [Phycisphaeraceae bacterium]
MRKVALGLGCAAMLGTASTSWAALGVVVSEDFESYADTAAMSAVWAGFDGVLMNQIDDDLDGNPEVSGIGNFAFHPGGSVNTLDLANPIFATSTEWIRLRVDIYDNATNLDPFFPLNPDNKRMSLGLRSTAPANIVELGIWNSPGHFAYRGILFDSINGTPNPNWQAWDMGTEAFDIDGSGVIEPDEENIPVNRFRGGAWYTLQATIKPESVLYEFDLDYDGTFDFAVEHFDMPHTADGFNQLRFGSPSGITSAGGGLTFDNILLEIIAAVNPLDGDLDGDGFVGISDLNIILGNWNQNVTAGDLLAGDPSGDGFVGIDDLNQVLGNWNAGTPPASGAAVPEPATLALLGLGGLMALRRR